MRKDIAMVARTAGKPKTGYVVKDLIEDMEEFLGYHNTTRLFWSGPDRWEAHCCRIGDLNSMGWKLSWPSMRTSQEREKRWEIR